MIQKKKNINTLKSRLSGLVQKIFNYSRYLSPTYLNSRFRSGNVFSRVLRLVFEKRIVRKVFGAQLAASVLMFSPFLTSQHPDELAYPGIGTANVVLEVPVEAKIATESVLMQNPVSGFVGVSTRFRGGHAGYDLRAPLGTGVYPVLEGTVDRVIHSTHGYGRRVILKHDDGFESLYAHMGLVSINEGDVVDLNTRLGEVGLTGLTTGPHIHLELYKDGVPVNPGFYLNLEDLPSEQ
ncbi:M23 family metallopeptidase [Patescibacteria group bacterium]